MTRGPGRRRARRAGAGALIAGMAGLVSFASTVGTVGVAAPASAHNVVVDTSPTADSTVSEAPETVDITFDDVVLNLSADGTSTVVTVTDADGAEHATGCATTQDRTVSVPVNLGAAGEYTVDWRIVSADGHPTSGRFSFTYAPAAGAPGASAPGASTSAAPAAGCEAATSTSGGSAGAEPGSESGSEAGSESPAGAASGPAAGGDDLLVVLGIAGGVVVLAGAAVLIALRVARRRG